MGASIATFICALGVCGLFFLNRDDSTGTSKFLWLPVIWLWISASRSISVWLGLTSDAAGHATAGNWIDQLVAGLLIVFGIIAIIQRRRTSMAVLRASWPMALYFLFCLFSLVFSDFPEWGLKRWFRALGDLVMVMVVVTDAQPAAALRRLFSRAGFILFPASILLTKYFPDLSRYYTPEGMLLVGGVTTNKNTLGVGAFLLALGALWQVLGLLADRNQPHRNRRLLAQCALLLMGIDLLRMAHSATSGACFVLGAFLMLSTPLIKRRRAALHALVLVILVGGGITKLVGIQSEVMKGMGRSSDLTGRTEIWKVLGEMETNPFVGTGFETFWYGPRLEYMNHKFPGINESHNGYLEVWLNLGGIGLILIVLILAQGYFRALHVFRRDPPLGGLLVAYLVTAVTYNVAEAGFRMLSPEWIFIVLAVVAAGRFSRLVDRPSQPRASRKRESVWEPASLESNLSQWEPTTTKFSWPPMSRPGIAN